MASNKESRESSAKFAGDPRILEGQIYCNMYESRIHYPMTYCNYPFNVIWAIVNVSSSSRTFSAALTQKHQLTKSQRSKHTVNTNWSRAFVQTGHFKFDIGYPEFSAAGCECARVRVCGRCATTRSMGAGGGAKLTSRGSLPASLRKSPIASVPSLNDAHFACTIFLIPTVPPENDCR